MILKIQQVKSLTTDAYFKFVAKSVSRLIILGVIFVFSWDREHLNLTLSLMKKKIKDGGYVWLTLKLEVLNTYQNSIIQQRSVWTLRYKSNYFSVLFSNWKFHRKTSKTQGCIIVDRYVLHWYQTIGSRKRLWTELLWELSQELIGQSS